MVEEGKIVELARDEEVEPSKNRLKVVRYSESSKGYVVVFDQPFRYNAPGGKRDVKFLKGVNKKQLSAMLPNYNGEGDKELRGVFEYDQIRVRGLINHLYTRRERY